MERSDRFDDGPACSAPTLLQRAHVAAFCGIAVMAKASLPGRTKTRLVPPLSYDQAAAVNTAFLQDITENMLAAAALAAPAASISAYAAYGPIGTQDFFEQKVSATIRLIPAWLPNFGDCLFGTITQMFARGHAAAVVLNSDSPTLPTALLTDAAEILSRSGDLAVIGPSSDGGYYLLGLKGPHRRLFESIDWSTERVAAQTRDRAREIGLPVHELPTWHDVDDIAGLERVRDELLQLASRPPGGRYAPRYAQHTASLLDVLFPRRGGAGCCGQTENSAAADFFNRFDSSADKPS